MRYKVKRICIEKNKKKNLYYSEFFYLNNNKKFIDVI
jgi:hypothetical protein